MIELIDNCVQCDRPCIYDACRYYKRNYLCCDVCGEVIRAAEENDEEEAICKRCLEKMEEVEEE